MQPELNIGLVGHVDHGKTTLTQRLSGKWADTHSEELKRGITIRLGYADTTIRVIPGRDGFEKYTTKEEVDGVKTEPVRTVSLIDAPGHESLMATMIAGASLLDAALLLVAANEHCPQAQTIEHLMALEMTGIQNIIVVQNKVDLITTERAVENAKQIREFLSKTRFKDAPIIPISALHDVNIDVLLAAIQEFFPTPKRDLNANPRFLVARSFDINKPGTKPGAMKGGVLGGAMLSGIFRVGDEIEIRPGRLVEEANRRVAKPIRTFCTGFMSGGEPKKELVPGGSSSILTSLDPALVKSDSLTGSVVGLPGQMPPTWYSFKLKVELLDRVVGSEQKIDDLKLKEMLLLNVHSAATVGVVTNISKNHAELLLKVPVCAELNSRVTISRRIGTRFRLVGYGYIVDGDCQE